MKRKKKRMLGFKERRLDRGEKKKEIVMVCKKKINRE